MSNWTIGKRIRNLESVKKLKYIQLSINHVNLKLPI